MVERVVGGGGGTHTVFRLSSHEKVVYTDWQLNVHFCYVNVVKFMEIIAPI